MRHILYKLTLLVFISFVFTCAITQTPTKDYYPSGEVRSIGFYNSDDAPEGKWIFYFENGDLWKDGNFNKGKKDGFWQEYSKEGIISHLYHYALGKANGQQIEYHENGQISFSGISINDRPFGTWKMFSAAGKKTMEYRYFNNVDSAQMLNYHDNGQLSRRGIIYNNTSVGLWEYYNDKGDTLQLAHYEKGILEGNCKQFSANGILESSGPMIDGVKNGHWEMFHSNGQVQQSGDYQNDIRIGDWFHHDKNGVIWQKFQIKDETYNGPTTIYFNDGKIKAEGQYTTGIETGKWTFNYPNGTISARGDLRGDNRLGDWEFFNEDGTPSNDLEFLVEATAFDLAMRNVMYVNTYESVIFFDTLFQNLEVYFEDNVKKVDFNKLNGLLKRCQVANDKAISLAQEVPSFRKDEDFKKKYSDYLRSEQLALTELNKWLKLLKDEGESKSTISTYDMAYSRLMAMGEFELASKKALKIFHGRFKLSVKNWICLGDCINGKGVKKWFTGSIDEGEWINRELDGKGSKNYGRGPWEGDTYVGELNEGYLNGQGTYFDKDEDVTYVGEYLKDSPNGFGTLSRLAKSDHPGKKYTGMWKNGKRHGQGTQFYGKNGPKEDQKYNGGWAFNGYEGAGRYDWPNGSFFIGTWKENLQSGLGTLTLTNGETLSGKWIEGACSKITDQLTPEQLTYFNF
ncbi:MAG: antitoxin component YwqK of YwqJK toxin-antitoxin module [Parvicellaceae bacterium]|jgi:antitoxin component YwqK of YwqJK toxin-antitoxin module